MRKILVATGLLAAVGMATATAETVYGLTQSQQLVAFDHSSPSTVLGTSPAISGLGSGESIVDIDFYPVNGQMYGMATSGNLYRINPLTGVATLDVAPQSPINGPTDADFNPQADRLRVFGINGGNFRITPSTNTAGSTGGNAGLVSSDGTIVNAAGGPLTTLVANAYTNNVDGTASTTLLSIDGAGDSLVTHTGAPQFNNTSVVGPLGIDVGNNVGFDISPSGLSLLSNGNDLYSINVGTGSTSSLGSIGTLLGVTTIAILPEPTSLALLALAALAIRRR